MNNQEKVTEAPTWDNEESDDCVPQFQKIRRKQRMKAMKCKGKKKGR
jgi:hypothetical protein